MDAQRSVPRFGLGSARPHGVPLSVHERAAVAAIVTSVLALIVARASAQDIYRWVDENGVVSFGEAVPEGVEEFERVNVAPSPPPAAESPPAAPAQAADAPRIEPNRPVEPAPVGRSAGTAPSEMSLEQLDRLCEQARESAIAPLRQAAIEECKAAPRTEPAYCERFYADYGDAVRLPSGAMRPRLFDDLPACVRAQEARSAR